MDEPDIVGIGKPNQQTSVEQTAPLGAVSLGSIARRQSRHVVDDVDDSPSGAFVPASDSQVIVRSTQQTSGSQ